MFKIKVHQEIQLEDNPNYICRNYDSPGEYDSCLEAEFTRQSLSLLNCTPPWLTEDRGTWCHHRLNVSEERKKEVTFFFENLSFGKADGGSCLSPCRTTWYESQPLGFQPTSDRTGLRVVLDTEVLQTVSELQIGPKTLATRIGGIIGVGKELLWILIFCFTTVSTLVLTLKERCCTNNHQQKH